VRASVSDLALLSNRSTHIAVHILKLNDASLSLPPSLQYLVAYDLLSKNEDKLSTKDSNFGSRMTI